MSRHPCHLTRLLLVILTGAGVWLAALPTALPGPAALAAGGTTLTLNQVDDSAFPDVVAFATLSDATGMPIGGVPVTGFAAAEDGRPIAGLTVKPLVNEQRSIAVILALDVSGSMQGAPLEATRAAAKSLVEGLGPQDSVAILAFSQRVKWLQDFTVERPKLLQALDNLTAGDDTAFNDALYDAVVRIAGLPPGRRAIVVLTDGEDTASTISRDLSIAKAQASGAPVFTVGYGPRIKPEPLRQIASLTGGQYFEAPQAAELQGSFQRILQQLKQQYAFTYRSQIAPDMREHELLVRATYAQDVLEDRRQFLARAVAPAITMPGVKADAVLRGKIQLAPEIVAASPISQATYVVDGAPLATVTKSPFDLAWDTATTAPGKHTVSLRVVDRDGHQGEWSAQITVAPPLTIRFRAPLDGERIGGQVTLAVEWQAAYTLTEVIYRLDGQLLGSVTAPPYQMIWKTGAAAQGPHQLTAQARDTANNAADAGIQVTVVPPVSVQLRAPGAGDIVSGATTVIAEVRANSGLARVEFLVDGEQRGVRETGPFEFAWDSSTVKSGEHTLLVRATDLLGERSEDQVVVKVPLPQSNLPVVWRWILLGGGVLLAVLLAFLARWRIRRFRRPPVIGSNSFPGRLAAGAWLVWQRHDGDEERFALTEAENSIGRSAAENRVVIASPTISRKHALIAISNGAYVLHNLSERSVSLVNGAPVRDAYPLQPGDQIELGDERFTFILQEEERER